MRSARLAALAACSLAASVAHAQTPPAAAPATILVVPFDPQAGVPEWAPYALADAVTDLVAVANRDNFLTLKQLDAVLRRRDLRLTDITDLGVALPVARATGATDLVTGELRRVGDRYFLTARRVDVPSKKVKKATHIDVTVAEIASLAPRLAQALLDVPADLGTYTVNPAAFEAGARCMYETIRQPLGPFAKVALGAERRVDAEGACAVALELDPGHTGARAALAVLLSSTNDFQRARVEAKRAREKRFNALAWLAESFALRRAGDDKGAMATLEQAVAERPGFLHALGYLGDDYLSDKRWADALRVFDAYLARAPNHPWALARKGKVLARMGKHDDAIAITRAALQTDPGDPELLIELGSRLIDADKDAEAEVPLREALTAYPVRPTAYLRLGYVFLRRRNAAEARPMLERAAAEAWREDESRTRGLAHADLARVAGLEGDLDAAVKHLLAARAEGAPKKLPCDEPELAAFKGKAAFDAACARPR